MTGLTLLYTDTSPYARKVRIVALEKGLDLKLQATPPLGDPSNLQQANPLGKVPALVADGDTFYDSPVICEYLDTLAQPRLIPAEGQARFRVLRLQALADGVLDAAVAMRIERMREESLHWDVWFDRYRRAIMRSLDELERRASDEIAGRMDLGAIAAAVATGYLDFRWLDIEWRRGRPALSEAIEALSTRDSFKATLPPDNA